jgi:hypothetical protein
MLVDNGNTFLSNVGNHLTSNTVSYPGKAESSRYNQVLACGTFNILYTLSKHDKDLHFNLN